MPGQWLKAAQLIELVDLLKLNQEIGDDVSGVQTELGKIQRDVESDKKMKHLGDMYGGNLYDKLYTAKIPSISMLSKPNTSNVTWILLALNFVGTLINAVVFSFNIKAYDFSILSDLPFYLLVKFAWHFFSSYSWPHFFISSIFFILFAQAAEKKLGSNRFFIMILITPLCLLTLKVINLLWDITGDPIGLGVVTAGAMGTLFLNHRDLKIGGGFKSYYYEFSAALLALLWLVLQFLMLGPIEWSVEWTSQCFTFVLWLLAVLLIP